MSETLLPCPFCTAEVNCTAAFANGYGTYYSIQCECGIGINHPNEAQIVERWNRRVGVTSQDKSQAS